MEMAIMCFICLVTGYALCYMSMSKSAEPKAAEDPREIMVKRVRTSMRSPLKTVRTEYDKYKTNGSELYAPVRPSPKRDDVEVGR